MQFLRSLVFPGGFIPHGYGSLWTPGLIGLHVVSDSLIALSCFSIPITLFYFSRRRGDIPFRWIFLCFGSFIVACGGTHLMEVWTIWAPSYWLAGGVKAVTAALSVATAILLIWIAPKALALRGNEWLIELTRSLSGEVRAHEETESGLRRTGEQLEKRVTERTNALMAANKSLSESESRYRVLVEHAPEAIVVLDLDSGKFQDANPKAERLFGMPREEISRLGPVELSPLYQKDGRLSSEAARAKLEWSRNHQFTRFEWTHCNSAGTEIPCEISLVRLPASGRNLVRASIVDISERKKAVEEIHRLNAELEGRVRERTAQLESANRDLESFTYSVSHDLRAPLRHMEGFSRILVEDYGPDLPPGARLHIERVRAATLHMGHLVDDLLNLARVGRGAVRIVTTDLNELAAETILSLEIETRGRTIDWHVGRLSPAKCDPGLMRHVFSNLLANALKFTRERERAVIEIGETSADGAPVIFVRDNGVGFDMKYADKLFQVFQRLHNEEEFEGTGVGLAIAHRILQKHGGGIRAEASPQNGAAFYFTVNQPLPLRPVAAELAGGAT